MFYRNGFIRPVQQRFFEHPPSPLDFLYGANNPHFSFVKDLFEQMDAVIQILPAFYRWGTVSDVMDRIEEEA